MKHGLSLLANIKSSAPIVALAVTVSITVCSSSGAGIKGALSELTHADSSHASGTHFNTRNGAVQTPWAAWLENPLDTTVSLQVRSRTATNTVTTVFLGTTNWAVPGISCTNTSTNVFSLNIKPYQPIMLVVTGASADSIKIDLSAIDSPSLLHPVDLRSKIPRGSKLLIDDVESGSIASPDPLGCTTYSNSWKIELRRQDNPKWRLDDDTDEPDRVPSEAFSPRIGPGKSSLTNHCAIEWNVSLGHLVDGNRAGKLQIREPVLSSAIYTPAALYYATKSTDVRSQVQIVTNAADNTIRQMRTRQAFVDIVPMTNQYEIRFYFLAQVSSSTNAQGLYTVTNPPFATWQILNPDQSTNTCNRLHIVELRGDQGWTNKIAFDSSQGIWTLTTGKGAEERQEKRTITFASSPTRRIESVEIRYTSGATAHKSKETYELKSWGWELVEAIVDPDGAALTTSFAFYDQVSDVGYGRLKWIINPDGNWEKRLYGVAWAGGPVVMTDVLQPWKDQPSHPSNADTSNSYDIWYYYSQVNGPGSLAVLMEEFPPEGEFTGYIWGGSARATGSITGDHNAQVKYRKQGQLFYDGYPHSATGPQPSGLYYNEGQGPGLANQPLIEQNGWNAIHNFFYDFGSYDAVAEAFTVSNQPGLGPAGPAWRASELLGTDYPIARESDSLSYPYRSYFPYDIVEQCQGHAIEQGGLYGLMFAMERFRGTKVTRIFEGGVLRQTEHFVYTGLDLNKEPEFEPLEKMVYTCDSLGHATNIVRVDPLSGQRRTVYTANWRGTNSVDGVLLLSETDGSGTTRTYTYDSLKRTAQATKEEFSGAGAPAQAAISVANTFDASGRILSERTVGGSLQQTIARAFDLAGRVCFETNASGLVTAFTYSQGGLSDTITFPGGATGIRERYLDRRLKSVTGTSAVAEYHTYGGDSGTLDGGVSLGYIRWETNMLGSPNSGRYTSTGVGLGDRVGNVSKPGFFHTNLVETTYIYQNTIWAWPRNLLTMIVPPSGPIQRFEYDSYLEMTRSSLCKQPFLGMDLLDLAGTDRISDTEWFFLKQGNAWFRGITNLAFLADNSSTRTVQSVTLERQTGFTGSTAAETTTIDVNSNATVVTTTIDRANKTVTETGNSPQSSLDAVRVTVNGIMQSESTPTVSAPTQYRYDSLARQTQVISPAGAMHTAAYDPVTGQMTSRTDFAGNTTSYEYYSGSHTNAGRLKCETAANGKKTYYAYNLRGQLTLKWGDVPYPEQRTYDQYGDLTELRTYRGGTGWAGGSWPVSPGTADVTTWTYDTPSGLLASKTDAAGRSVTYDYYTNNLLRSRTWARGVYTTNLYTAQGDLYRLDYSDGTPSITFTNYNRAGQPRTIIDAAGERTLVYDHAGRLVMEIGVSGLLAGVTVTNHFNALGQRDALGVLGSSPTVQHSFAFDTYGRLGSVAAGDESAEYTYLPGTDRLQDTVFKHSGNAVLTSHRTWESGERLQSIANGTTSDTVSGHQYLYDAVHRRTQATLADGSRWQYGYNDRDEVVSGKRSWADWKPVAGQQYEYAFDAIGNRTSTGAGGDERGAALRAAANSANELNQYTAITNAPYAPVVGAALATNAVTVCGSTNGVSRRCEYFHREITVTNASGPVWTGVTVSSGGGSTNGGSAQPGAQQSLIYDYDGNLTWDGTWNFRWDAENRLVEMTMTNIASVPATQRKKLQFTYDFQGRRVQKAIAAWNGSAFTNGPTRKFVYDGWNLLAVLTSDLGLLTSFAWGQDLSGSMQGAGGIGGLVAVFEISNGQISNSHYPCYDGNGNVMALVDRSTNITARYDYGPFGEPIRVTGTAAGLNPFRWSTKFADEEGGLVYYGYRYYSPTWGRFISRDPVEEDGGLNLYAFVQNSPLRAIDPDGRLLLLDLLLGSTEDAVHYGYAASVYGRMCATLVNALQGAINVGLYGSVIAASRVSEGMYSATSKALMYCPTLAFEAPSFFTGYFLPGPTDMNVGGFLGGALSNAENIGRMAGEMEAQFEAFMDSVTADMPTPEEGFPLIPLSY